MAPRRADVSQIGGCATICDYSTVEAMRTLDLFERTLAIFEDHYLDILNEIDESGETQRWWRRPQRGFRRRYLD
jgi:hypothetical protein